MSSLLPGLHDDSGILQHVGVTASFTMDAQAARDGARSPSQESDGRPPLAGVGGSRRRIEPPARCAESVERGQGLVVGTASDLTGLRGAVRSHAGHRFRHAAFFLR